MTSERSNTSQRGFTLIEMLVALGIFLLVTGAAFTLLTSSQQQYQTETQVLNSFQEARLGLDQMVRDINVAGFPPPTFVNLDPTESRARHSHGALATPALRAKLELLAAELASLPRILPRAISTSS